MDHSSQKYLIEGISKGIGTGNIEHLNSEESILKENALELKIDLCFKPSSLMHDETKESQDFIWHSEGGMIENILKIRNEFNQFRGLKPVRICLIGPPVSGKT